MKVKIHEQIVENCSIRFLDHENMVLDTDIVFLGSILTELWTI